MTSATPDFYHFVDWQWNVNAWGKQDSPSTAVNYYLLSIQGETPRDAMAERAVKWLRYGQRSSPEALGACQRLLDEVGIDAMFWAVACSGARSADVEAAATHLEWQAHSDPLSLAGAAHAWAEAAACADSAQAIRRRVRGAFSLLAGQAHNHNAAQLYRACMRWAAPEFFEAVSTMVDRLLRDELIHPYLMGAEPSALSIRDEVPTGDLASAQ